MNEPSPSIDDRRTGMARWSVVLLFIGSGCAALMYELVWFHLLRLVIGSSYISLGILLASFMGGMCLGSFALARLVSERHHPLRVYAVLELIIGVFGATLPWWLPWLNDWYLSVASESFTDVWARSVVAAAAVIPATFLMGATLPAVARWVKSTPDGLAQLGVFYGANTFGAVLGCLFAGFVMLPRTDVVITSYVAAAINFVVAVMAWLIARASEYTPAAATSNAPSGERVNASGLVCLVAALSGYTALSAEVIWTRLLAMQFGSTVYTFAIILAVFLAGIGLGSAAAARWVRRTRRPILSLAVVQLGVACLVPFANYAITRIVPGWERPSVYSPEDAYRVYFHDTMRTMLAVFPSALLWGASFPLALAAAGTKGTDPGRLVGQIYAANTLGAIAGALLTSSWIVPWVGSQHAQQILAATAGVAALVAWLAAGWKSTGNRPDRSPPDDAAAGALATSRQALYRPHVGLIAIAIVASAVWLTIAPPYGFFGRSQQPGTWSKYDMLYQEEGRSSTVAVLGIEGEPYRFISISGQIEASNTRIDLRCQRLLGHLGALIHSAPKKTLTVGMGTGSTAGCFVLHPEIEENVICEIEPMVRPAAGGFFVEANNGVIDNERTRIHFDDGRHFLAITDEKFDIITADPVEPWRRGTAALYSAEYYEWCKRRLNPGGILVQWMSLYEKDVPTAKCELATFLTVFPDATFWTSWAESDGYDRNHDIIAVGQLDPKPLDLAEIDRRIHANPKLQASLAEVDLSTIPELIGQFAGYGKDMRTWLADAQINRDRSLRLEYLAGRSIFFYRSHLIFEEIAQFRQYPADILTNDGPYEAEIRERFKPLEDDPEDL